MRIITHLRPFAAVVLAAAMALLAMPVASAQTGDGSTKHSYPGWGKTYTAAELVKQITDNAGKNMVDPSQPLFPAKGMSQTSPSGSSAKGKDAWFPQPGSAKADDGKCTVAQKVLQRDVIGAQIGPDGCTVVGGKIYNPKGGNFEDVAKGTPPVVVPIVGDQYAYGRGGAYLSADERAALMNDPLNLIAVPDYDHQSFGLGLLNTPSDYETEGRYEPEGPATGYMPSDPSLKEAYVLRFLQVMMKHGLALEASSVERLQTHTKGFASTVDTSSDAVLNLATSAFASTVKGLTLPEVQPTAAPSTKAPTAEPSKGSTSEPATTGGGGISPILIVGVLAMLAAVAAGIFYVISTRKKARQ